MLERDRGEDRVHDERAGGLAVVHKAAQDVPVPLARLENAGGRLGKPGGDRRLGLGGRKRAIEYPGMGRNPQKGPQREPREADEIMCGWPPARKDFFRVSATEGRLRSCVRPVVAAGGRRP